MNMETRINQLDQLHSFVEGVDKDLTMILQSLQWDRKHLLSVVPMVTCRYSNNHKLPLDKMEFHEPKCFMKLQGYTEDDELLPDPLDINANTLVKLSTQQIITILDNASRCNPMFKRGNNWERRCSEPCSVARLQATYTADERRAVHDAVVRAVPSCHDLADLALPSCSTDEGASRAKSRVEILAELRDMRRRRTKYRQAAKTRNYSDVLRDVIKTQMESYSGTAQFAEPTKHNNLTRSDLSSTRDRDSGANFPNKDMRGERPSKYCKSPGRDTNRYKSTTNNTYNSERTPTSGSYGREGQEQSDRHRSYRNEKFRDRDDYNRNDSKGEKPYGKESRDKNSLSHRRYEHKQYRTSDRSEMNFSRKRNRDTYSSDETEVSRTTDRDYRRRDRQSTSYGTYRSRVEQTDIKSERSESTDKARSGRTRSSPVYTHNKSSEFHTDIKQEKISPDMNEKRIHGNTSRRMDNSNSGSSACVKVEKPETESRYSYNRSESEPSLYTGDKREDHITTNQENINSTDNRNESRRDESRHETTSKDRHSKHSGRIDYFQRNSERHYRDSSNSNRDNRFPIKKESGENDTNTKNKRYYVKNMNKREENTKSQRHHRKSSSSASSDIDDRRRREKYDRL